MKTKLIGFLALLVGCLATSAYSQTWNLAGDWNPTANPNGTWSYGEMVGGNFVPLAWNNLNGSYGDNSGGFVDKNTSGSFAYGIDPSQISLESDWGSAAVQWTAPATGSYSLMVLIGGSTALGGGGWGNNFANSAGLIINGVNQIDTSYSGNVMSWIFNNVPLNAGETVDAFVLNPGFAYGGNTEAQFTITAVPEPGVCALLGLGMLGLLRCRKIFKLRVDHAAGSTFIAACCS